MLPFSTEQFFDAFERYNTDLPFAGVILSILALAGVVFGSAKAARSGSVLVIVLAFLWFWAGAVYHLGYFAEVNTAAYFFGAAFILQAVLLAIAGLWKARLDLEVRWDRFGLAGALLAFYALVLYPVTGYLIGHIPPRAPSFGLPCPLTIFTFGVLLWSRRPVPFYLLVIPVLWTLIGSSAAILLGVWEDLALLLAGCIGILLILEARKKDQGVESFRKPA